METALGAPNQFAWTVLRNPIINRLWVPSVAAFLGSTLWSFFPGVAGFPFLVLGEITTLIWWLAGLVRSDNDIFRSRWNQLGRRGLSLALSVPLVVIGFRS